jgi:hypothetical protein
MRRLLPGGLGSDPLAIDQDTADRLLAGRLDPADAPPEYAEVAKVLAAAAAPSSPDELGGEAAATAAFARERPTRPGADSHTAPGRRPRRVSTRFAVVAVALAVLMVGGVAAATTGTLPGPVQRLVDSVSRTAHHHQPTSPPRQRDVGGARTSGHDQAPSVGGGRAAVKPGNGHHGGGPGSTGRGATGKAKATRDVHGVPKAKPGGAHSKRTAASHSAKQPKADGRAEGHRKEKGE